MEMAIKQPMFAKFQQTITVGVPNVHRAGKINKKWKIKIFHQCLAFYISELMQDRKTVIVENADNVYDLKWLLTIQIL